MTTRGIEARSDETRNATQPEGREPGPQDAPGTHGGITPPSPDRAREPLKPCPFCGSVAGYGRTDDGSFYIECSWGACNATTNLRYTNPEDGLSKVIEQWNRRDEPRTLAGEEGIKRRYRHKGRGTIYREVGGAELQAASGPVEEGAILTVYRAEHDGKLWARRASEFGDGRFERIEATPPGQEPSPTKTYSGEADRG